MWAAVCMIAITENYMCLSSKWGRGNHWQQRTLFVGVLVDEDEVRACLPRLRWQLASGRSVWGSIEAGNAATLSGVGAARHSKCVAPRAHPHLARAVLLLCSGLVCL